MNFYTALRIPRVCGLSCLLKVLVLCRVVFSLQTHPSTLSTVRKYNRASPRQTRQQIRTATTLQMAATDTACSYYYFAYGSNMYPPTMQSFRGIQPLSATAAILPNYQLTFQAGSAATVRPLSPLLNAPVAAVQGVLYELTENDFARVGWTEGVPFGYTWENCQVLPFVGNGECAGQDAMKNYMSRQQQENDVTSTFHYQKEEKQGDDDDDDDEESSLLIPAYTLVSTSLSLFGQENFSFSPPSASYVQLLQRGASYWKLDREYQIFLSQVTTRQAGVENCLVTWAERLNPPSSSLL